MKATQRIKKRYILFQVHEKLSTEEVKKIIYQHFLRFFGEFYVADVELKLINYDQKTDRGILRCSRTKLEETIFCLACFNGTKELKKRIEPLCTGGTIKSLQKIKSL
jgi:ribonuclease P/MRP protein subunit POP5